MRRAPLHGREGVLGGGGELVLGREPVVDGHHDAPGAVAQIARDRIVGVEVADDVSAAVVVHERRQAASIGIGIGIGAVDAHRQIAGHARNRAVLDRADRGRRDSARLHHSLVLLPRLRRSQPVDGPEFRRGQHVDHLLNLRVDRHRGHGVPPGALATVVRVVPGCASGGKPVYGTPHRPEDEEDMP